MSVPEQNLSERGHIDNIFIKKTEEKKKGWTQDPGEPVVSVAMPMLWSQ